MKLKIHAFAATIAFLTIFAFWTSTVISEAFGSEATIASVKAAIVWGLLVLIPSIAITGATGMSLGKGRNETLVVKKKNRMPFIAGNGLLVLVPCAFYLDARAGAGAFDTVFYAVQGLELAAGALNLFLIGRNIRDGLALSGRVASRH